MTDAPHPSTLIEALLKERIGLDAASVGRGTIERAVEERRQAMGADDPATYWNLLHAVPDELQALIESVVVPETWFFRHREALLALARFAAQRVFGAGEPMLRILSLPCSTGEEPYSIAMALLDAGIPGDRFRIDAIDISARALERARAAVYGDNAFRSQPLDFRDRYFMSVTGTQATYQLLPKVRNQVRLLCGNLVDPDLLRHEAPYHFAFCRNLMIYFDPATQCEAIRTLRRLTRPDGMIFVGPAEASLLTREGLAGAGVPLGFAFHAQPASPSSHASAAHTVMPPQPMIARARSAATAPAKHAARAPDVAASNPSAQPASAPSRDAALAAIAAMADRGELDRALAACQLFLTEHGTSADGWCLLGVLHDASGRATEAHAAYRKAVYLDPGHEEALYHLAALLDSAGDAAGAHRLRERAQRHARMSHG
ncbi:chemotaxis protein methyltransferase WspC [Cupriavidus metallidurans]|jgi:chemotaxis protein methyltransferase WspC|uniref:Chemotaxis MCP methyltransferase, CheR-type n=1 Tax=Cupriavidus metallidurans (strain ATCC 43123 / DSM 2839 / NBRC 102507 / CH34) TaxID=266264 RepID=Q1LG87_CUPMC|nr:protein-glutamate O-methyltransferase CheR [Cupriavidus metallidurans]ABF10839.1 putative chemotaxis MCP methyltransferase, CheR-type [Cupriavidus metallidurans CH34]AVA34977.1 chemotaxis protein CheW [Cupriavidus metallidurans]KWW39670.1 putative biofilm formation methyltransferase WspC [Cupriavidus metallidurans]MDE4920886.1 chemotaxis protein CheW [Cupriavidus metallidurans]QGS31707.1 chemotaxis protein CheW [Cupriavidus metallidurans]